MKPSLKTVAFAPAMLALAGCFTVSQSEYPRTAPSKAPSAECRVAIAGFETLRTSYTPVYGYSTVWAESPGWYGRHGRYHPGYLHPETVSTTTYVPETSVSSEFAQKAQDEFESAGFIVSPSNAAYVVEGRFDAAPVGAGEDGWKEAAVLIFSAFTADYDCVNWSAKLKIVDSATGRVLFLRRYDQEYYATVFSPIPVFGILGAETTSGGYIKNWCLSALTDRMAADATAFIAAHGAGAAAGAPAAAGAEGGAR